MASHPREDNHPSMFTSKTPHFFKIILLETLQDGILGIPRKFVRKYGNQLSSFVKLEVPSGVIWHVELTKSNGKVQLQNGWREFAEHYSLEVGSFVVFRYEGNGHFHVLIFDKTAFEIEYPYSSTGDDDFCDEVSASRRGKEKRELPCPFPQKKMRTDSPNQPGTNSKYAVLSSDIRHDDNKSSRINLGNLKKVETSQGQLDAQRSVKTEDFSCVQKLTATEKTHALQIASAFKSTGNPVFMVVMQPSFVSKNYRMGVPWDFARNFLPMHNCDLTLLNSAGKTWLVNYYSNAKIRIPQAQLYGGWRAFVEDNHLTVGDICVFELIKSPKILMKVLIYPAVENASKTCRPHLSRKSKEKSHIPCPLPRKKMRTDSPHTPGMNSKLEASSSDISPDDSKSSRINLGNLKQVVPRQLDAQRSVKTEAFSCVQRLTDTEKAHAVQIANAFKTTGNPFFMVVMQPSFVSYCYRMGIPPDFARKYFPKHNCDLTLVDSAGKTWPVKYYYGTENKKPRPRLYGGWKAFAEDSHLCVRDICVFVLIKRHPEILLKVVINPVVENASKVSGPLAHGNIASRVTTRSLINDTEPNCQQSPCPSSSIKMEDSSVSYIEILDDVPLNQNVKKKSTSLSFQPCKVMRTNPSGSIQAKEIKLENEKRSTCFQSITKELADRSVKPRVLSCLQKLTDTEKARAIQRASASKSTEGPVFMVVMQPSFLCNIYSKMCIPSAFCRKYLPMHNCDVTLLNSAGETWPVSYSYEAEYRRAKFYGGWQAFVEDNHLDVGDICVFELIKHLEILMKVVIYPVSDNVTKVCRTPSPDELNSPKDDSTRISIGRRCLKPEFTGKIKIEPFTPNEKQKACTSNPSFSVVIQPSSACTSLNIPEAFAKRCLQKNGEMILRVPDGRTWTVDYDDQGKASSSEPRSASFGCNSWRKFAIDNELKVGDVCNFELIKENGNLLEVVIQRKLLLVEID